MNVPNESIKDLIARYGPQRAGRYAALRPHAELIGELRRNRASYDTIVAILSERHGVQVSDTSVRRFCHEVLQEHGGRQPARKPLSPRSASTKKVGPQIAEVEFIDEPKPDQRL